MALPSFDSYLNYGDDTGTRYEFGTPTNLYSDPMATAAANVPAPGSTTGGLGSTTTPPGPGDIKSDWGWNFGTVDIALKGLGTIAGIWQAWEQMKLQKEALKLQKEATNINLANQIEAYNTQLIDRINNRVESGGWDSSRGDTYLAEHSLANRQIG